MIDVPERFAEWAALGYIVAVAIGAPAFLYWWMVHEPENGDD